MDEETRRKVEVRLKRIAGQVGGIQRMVEADRYCVDVLLQIAAARAALGKVGRILLESHLKTCVVEAFEAGRRRERQEKVEELVSVFDRFCD
ncbi:MAG: transcriptional regulator [Deltaproteobacteria bacterium]|nr:MAG: transcriptional regulator [Deltaproteobacteria bacterium]